MLSKNPLRLSLGFVLLFAGVWKIWFFGIPVAQAQQTSFLGPPYFGTTTITAYFDHRYPTYSAFPNSTYPNVVIYTGAESASCNPYCYDGHDGVDFGLSYERVLAAADGVVTRAEWAVRNCHHSWNTTPSCSYGMVVEIQHANGSVTRYGHLSSMAVYLNQQVQGGQIIGTSGNTGNSSGPHLHFGVLTSNLQPTDPFGWSGNAADPWLTNSGVVSWCMWASGQWANVCGGVSRPIQAPANNGTIIVDDTTNNTGGFSKGNSWYSNLFANPCTGNCANWTLSTSGYLNGFYWTSADGNNGDTGTVDNWAKWQPSIGPGYYEVYVYVPPLPIDLGSWQAPYCVVNSSGSILGNIIVDEYTESLYPGDSYAHNRWLSLGIYYLQPGDYVWTHDATLEVAPGSGNSHCGAAWCRLGADAVKFVKQWTAYLPLVMNQ